MTQQEKDQLEQTQQNNRDLLDLLGEAYVFIAMKHKALNPWRIALDKWQSRVESLTGWDSYEKIASFRNDQPERG